MLNFIYFIRSIVLIINYITGIDEKKYDGGAAS